MTLDPQSFSLRPADSGDEDFLFALYAGSHGEDLAALGWGPDQIREFLKMQCEAEQRFFATEYPRADNQIVLMNEEPVGRVLVERRDFEIRGIDLSLLPEFRKLGIGSRLIEQLQAEAATKRKPVRMQLIRFSRAIPLFERLGFARVSESGTHYQMEWWDP
jgi:GNAT superfamily N-acetyltransferase